MGGGEAASGHYEFNEAGQLVINWGGGADETWQLVRGFDDTAGAYATFRLASGQHFNHGIMHGSNAGWDSRASMAGIAAVQNQPYSWIRGQGNDAPGVSFVWQVIGAGWSADTAGAQGYTACSATDMMTARHDCTGLGYCECGDDPNHWSSNYVQGIGQRRDAWHHWCECLTGGQLCYEGNSHVKPMLQAVDSNGNWVGWIGVEASFYPGGNSGGDMLGLFAIGEAVTSIGPALKMNHTVV